MFQIERKQIAKIIAFAEDVASFSLDLAFVSPNPLSCLHLSDLFLLPPSINSSGNINPLVILPFLSRYSLALSKPKHSESWAATPGAKRRQ
jgi:hypothetical protein